MEYLCPRNLFITKTVAKSLAQNFVLLISAKKGHHKILSLTDVGTNAKTLSTGNFIGEPQQIKFRTHCCKFFTKAVSYLQQNLPHDVK